MLYNDEQYPFKRFGGQGNSKNQIKVIAYSSPKVFSDQFKMGYPLGQENLLRVIHTLDPVGNFPIAGYKHLGKEMKIMKYDEDVFERLKIRRLDPMWHRIGENFLTGIYAAPLFHAMSGVADQIRSWSMRAKSMF